MATVHGTGGGAYDPLLSRRTYSQPKVDHTAEYVQMGTQMMNMLGSIFIANAQAGAQARAAGGAGGAGGAAQQQSSVAQTIIKGYEAADEAYDASRTKMSNALNQLDDMKAQQKDIETAETNLTELETNSNASNADNQAYINAFNEANEKFQAASAKYQQWSKLDKANTELKGQLPTDLGGLEDAGNGMKKAQNVKVNNSDETYDGSTYKLDTPFLGDGKDSTRVQVSISKKKDENTSTEVPQGVIDRFRARAEQQDKAFAAREAKANTYNNIQKQINQNELTMKGLAGGNDTMQEPQESDFTATVKLSNNETKDMNLTDLKNYQLSGQQNGSNHTVGSYSTEKDRLTNLKAKNTPDNIAKLKKNIENKENEIKNTLKPDLIQKKNAYDIAKKQFVELQNKAASQPGKADLESYENAVKNNGKHKKFLGMRIGKKTDAYKDLKAKQNEIAQSNAQFQNQYGVGNISNMLAQMTQSLTTHEANNGDIASIDTRLNEF